MPLASLPCCSVVLDLTTEAQCTVLEVQLNMQQGPALIREYSMPNPYRSPKEPGSGKDAKASKLWLCLAIATCFSIFGESFAQRAHGNWELQIAAQACFILAFVAGGWAVWQLFKKATGGTM